MTNVVRRSLDRAANSEGRDLRHIGLGLLLVGGGLLLSAVASKVADEEFLEHNGHPESDGLRPPLSALWTPLFLALTFSGLRVWNAPSGPRRSGALTLWALVQALNAVWMTLGPRRFGGSTQATFAATAAALAYLRAVEGLDRRAAGWVAPFVGWRSLAVVGLDGVRRAVQSHVHHTPTDDGATPVTVH